MKKKANCKIYMRMNFFKKNLIIMLHKNAKKMQNIKIIMFQMIILKS